MGPSYAVWYRGLDKLIVGSGVKQTLAKVALDQGIMAWVSFVAWVRSGNHGVGEFLVSGYGVSRPIWDACVRWYSEYGAET